MYILVGDEAGSREKEHQSVATMLGEKQAIEALSQSLTQTLPTHELKFARVRHNDSYLQEVKGALDMFFAACSNVELTLMVILGKASHLVWDEMYEELFLLSQSISLFSA